MRKYNLLRYATLAIAMMLLFANLVSAQYWFQSGVRGSNDAGSNNGGGVTIQTIYQNATDGSLGFWIGEDLSNGAFIQAGYEITNSTGYYSSDCGNNTKSVYIQAGTPTWFWEYFPINYDNNSFCGGIGPNGSAGKNGSFNTYSFKSIGNIWSAYFNGQQIGAVNLGAGNSGANPPSAFAEYAETASNKWPMDTVQFKNLFFYMGNLSRQVPEGYSVIGYGKGSLTALDNPYGVQEVDNFVNDFEVGSNIPVLQQKSKVLWSIGYNLNVVSAYGILNGSGNYSAYAVVPISAPQVMNISSGVREVFIGWKGVGTGSYTGNAASNQITIYQNITETAEWQRQYYLNASSSYGQVAGEGWYNANSVEHLQVETPIVETASGSREVFDGWSNGNSTNSTAVYMNGPKSLATLWKTQYHLDVLTPYGNVTGTGWYYVNQTANVSLNVAMVPVNNDSRYTFYDWSNGYSGQNIRITVASPVTLTAIFDKQYLIKLDPENSYGESIGNVSYYNVSGMQVNSSGLFFAFQNKSYNIEYIYYKGIPITTNYRFSVSGPLTLDFKNPIYNIVINTQSVFGTPINASMNITFKNNTKLTTYSGKNGTQVFRNVPYGYVAGYAEYFGIKESINAINGFSPYLTFLTASLFALIVGGILFVAAVALITTHYVKKRENAK